jgi:6-phosphogluconolactonase (cycloisomerase 2 family)
VLVVTEKATNKIDTYTVNEDGIASGPQVFASNGSVPFGFAFDIWGHAIVSEAATGALSSYAVAPNGALSVISPSVLAVGQRAACWVVTTKNGRFAYTTNAASGTISGYGVASNGKLTLLDANGITAQPGGTPLDMSISHDNQFLYAFNNGSHAINVYKIQANGSLSDLGNVPGLPAGGAGLAAW